MKNLTITQINIFPVKNAEGKLRAFAKVELNEALQLNGLRVYEGNNGLFVSYPAERSHKDDEYRHIYYPIAKELKDMLQKEVLAVYEAEALSRA